MGQYLILWVKDKHSAGLAGPERLLCEEKGKGTLEARGAALGHWHGWCLADIYYVERMNENHSLARKADPQAHHYNTTQALR